MFGPQTRQRAFELERFVDGFMDELFDRRLAPRSQRALAESAAEAFDAGDADAAHFGRFAVEDGHAGVGEDLSDLVLMAGLMVVVAEDGDGRLVERRHFAREDAGLVRQTGIGQIAGEEQRIRRARTPD